jgi:hypothetical protein
VTAIFDNTEFIDDVLGGDPDVARDVEKLKRLVDDALLGGFTLVKLSEDARYYLDDLLNKAIAVSNFYDPSWTASSIALH